MTHPTDPLPGTHHNFFFPGRPTDSEASILATGTGDANTAFLGLSARSETAQDAEYIHWHLHDHAPEQARIPGVRNGQRWISTPECHAARPVQAAPFDKVVHAVQYLFGEPVVPTVEAFMELGGALAAAGRQLLSVPRVQSAVYAVTDRQTNPRGALGSFALPWWPARGIYLTIEETPAEGEAVNVQREALGRLVALDGVAGAWRYAGMKRPLPVGRSLPEQTITVFYLYADPVAMAQRLGNALDREWSTYDAKVQLAAPLEIVRAEAWDRHLP